MDQGLSHKECQHAVVESIQTRNTENHMRKNRPERWDGNQKGRVGRKPREEGLDSGRNEQH